MKYNILKYHTIFIFLILYIAHFTRAQQTIEITSPDSKLTATLAISERLFLSVLLNESQVLNTASFYIKLEDDRFLGKKYPVIKSTNRRTVDEIVSAERWSTSTIRNHYNEVEINLGDYSWVVRVYNESVACKFKIESKKKIKVVRDFISINLGEYDHVFCPYAGYGSTFEPIYPYTEIKKVILDEPMVAPILMESQSGVYTFVGEVANDPYPGLFFTKPFDGQTLLRSNHAHLPAKVSEPGGSHGYVKNVQERHEYIAEMNPNEELPWRYFTFTEEPKDLLINQLPYLLTRKAKNKDYSWVVPGQVAWDWWNDYNLQGVPFETGVNNDTYKYYIDFAANFGLKYAIIDWQWTDVDDLTLFKQEVGIKELVDYAKNRQVSLMVWVPAYSLADQLDRVLDTYSEIGISGIKVDFFNRNDQSAQRLIHAIAQATNERNMIVDFHGAPQPTGLFRQYPNIITYEGVAGNEVNKWDTIVEPNHNVTLPFIRGVLGPMDYTPGAMQNVSRDVFVPNFPTPMTRGTRCHQLAMYVVYFSPFQMLCDAPTTYEKEPDFTRFLSEIPIIWDESIALAGQPGEYVAMARRSEKTWFVGVLNGWESKEVNLDLGFLDPEKEYSFELYRDGINVHRLPTDYLVERGSLKEFDKKIKLGEGGGAVLKITSL